MEYPRFYIYAPKPYECNDKYYVIPETQNQIAKKLRDRGFEYNLSCEKCEISYLRNMNGILLLKTDFGLMLHVVSCNDDLIIGDAQILVAQVYSDKMNREDLQVIKSIFTEIYGLGSPPRLTRSMQKLYKYWSPPPRIYVVASNECTLPGVY
jgi:hypothetical protein